MYRFLPFVLAISFASAAHAGENKPRFALGYAFANYMEDYGGNAPLGLFFAVQGLEDISIKGELAYHRDSDDYFTLNTFTGMVGPVLNFSSGDAQPFIHLLVGGREDRVEGEGNFAIGGELGAGVDLAINPTTFIRPGIDYQIFTDDGFTLNVLRLSVGIAW